MSRSDKLTPEEERLATMARVYAENLDNEVAWRRLLEAAQAIPRPGATGGFAPPPTSIEDVLNSMLRRSPFTRSGRVRTAPYPAYSPYDTSAEFARRQAEKERAARERVEKEYEDGKKQARKRADDDDQYPF